MPTNDLIIQAFTASEKSRLRRSAVAFGLIVVASVAVMAYTSAYVRRSLQEVSRANQTVVEVNRNAENARLYADYVRHELEEQLRNAREATQYVTEGINYYHQGNYAAAVRSYDQALTLDPRNSYIMNLRGYALFRQRDYRGAVTALKGSVEANPGYAWGYFDLARAECAIKDFEQARDSISTAISKRPDLRGIMRTDGEFTRICAPISDAYLK